MKLRLVQVALLCTACVLFFNVGRASAASYSDACAGVNNMDWAVCERVQVLSDAQQDTNDRLQLVWVGVWLGDGIVLVTLVSHEWHKAWRWFRVG